MKKLFNIALISILALGATDVQAQVLSADYVKSNITKEVVKTYKNYTDAQLDANVVALPFKDLTIPEGKVSFQVTSMNDKFMARDLKRVNVYVNGQLAKTFNAPVDVKAYKDVLVASCILEREKMLTSNVVISKKMEVSNSLEYALSSEMLSKQVITKKFFREGEIIDSRYVRMRPDVEKNELVKAVFQVENLKVEIDAIALKDGFIGDYIDLENREFKKTYRGKIVGENKVVIEI